MLANKCLNVCLLSDNEAKYTKKLGRIACIWQRKLFCHCLVAGDEWKGSVVGIFQFSDWTFHAQWTWTSTWKFPSHSAVDVKGEGKLFILLKFTFLQNNKLHCRLLQDHWIYLHLSSKYHPPNIILQAQQWLWIGFACNRGKV